MSVPEQLERILSSREFRDSQRMRRFLQFVVERALEGEASTLKEYLIGVAVRINQIVIEAVVFMVIVSYPTNEGIENKKHGFKPSEFPIQGFPSDTSFQCKNG